MKIHFTSSNSKEAISLKYKYSELYNQANLREADVIVAIGGDGEMLKALRLAIKNNSSVFGLNKGHIGFLMNKINKTNLGLKTKYKYEFLTNLTCNFMWGFRF